ncbi:MAG: DUF6259 domain-containing protein [Acidobacteriota bacterium]
MKKGCHILKIQYGCRVLVLFISTAILFSCFQTSILGNEIDDGDKVTLSIFTVANSNLQITFDSANGGIKQVRNLVRSLDLVKDTTGTIPWNLQTESGYTKNFISFAYHKDESFPDGEAYNLAWDTEIEGMRIEARVELPSDALNAGFTVNVLNSNAAQKVISIEYPIVRGIAALQPEGGDDFLAHPVATGYIFRNPYQNFKKGATNRKYKYPDGYSGAPVQFMEYFREGSGGFYLASLDPHGTVKNINFYKDKDDDYLWTTFEHFNWDTAPGNGFAPGYTTLIGILKEGNWYEGVERYKEWAIQQNWCSEGKLKDKNDAESSRWLIEKVGFATFGISINLDQTAWFNEMHKLIDAPVFHVSGFWWPGGTPDSEWYGGYNDWNDGRVNITNITKIHSNGDYLAPFIFNQHFSRNAKEWDEPSPDPATDPVAPWQPYEMIPDPEDNPWAYICPATQEWQDFHGWRDEKILRNYNTDACYYDIGVGLGRMKCENAGHSHPKGQGRWMIDAARAMLENNRDGVNNARGRFVPQGTEMISELFISQVDFYQARAGAGPMSMLEGDEFRDAEKSGWAEKIPIFDYIYHEYGPVRLDGNAKVAPEFGEIFYWIGGRIALWGALLELNYELSALERFPGMTLPWTWYETYKETYDVMDISPYGLDAGKKEFLKEISGARTGFAKDYLAYGMMARPARILTPVPKITLDWHLYNTFKRQTDTSSGIEKGQEYYEEGDHTVDGVLHQAWNHDNESLGLCFVNLQSFNQTIEIEVDPSKHGLEFLNYEVRKISSAEDMSLGHFSGTSTVSVDLSARKVVLVKAVPEACDGPDCLYRIYRSTSPINLKSPENVIATAQGNSYSDDVLNDEVNYYYLVDDGAGYPASINVVKSSTLDLTW